MRITPKDLGLEPGRFTEDTFHRLRREERGRRRMQKLLQPRPRVSAVKRLGKALAELPLPTPRERRLTIAEIKSRLGAIKMKHPVLQHES